MEIMGKWGNNNGHDILVGVSEVMQDPPSPHGFEKNGNLGFKMNDLSKIKDFIHNMWIWSFPKNEYPKSSKVTS